MVIRNIWKFLVTIEVYNLIYGVFDLIKTFGIDKEFFFESAMYNCE